MADVFGVLTGDLPRLRWRARPGIDSQDNFRQRRDERGVAVRRDRPASFQVRLKRPLFRTRPIVEWSIGGIPSVTSTCFSSSRNVQR